jgi:hypothetical protein
MVRNDDTEKERRMVRNSMKTGNKVDNTHSPTRQLGFGAWRFGCLVGRGRFVMGAAIFSEIVETVHSGRTRR